MIDKYFQLMGVLLLGLFSMIANATTVYEIEIRQHLFYPAELVIPRGEKVKLKIYNRDASPEEFESYELNREKVVMGNASVIVFIGPLSPGEYPFFGEFHQQTAQGKIIVH